MRYNNTEIVIYAIYYTGKPLIIPRIHEIVNYEFGVKLTYEEIENVIQRKIFFKSIPLRYEVEGCRKAYWLTQIGINKGATIRNRLSH